MHRLAIILAAAAQSSTAAAPPSRPVPAGYEIDASYDPTSLTFKARSRVSIAPRTVVDSFAFDLHSELQVTSVKVGGTELDCKQETVFYPANYSMTANEVTCPSRGVDLSRGIEIAYEGMINRSVVRGMSEYYRGDSTGLYMRGWASVLWMPIFLKDAMSFPPAPRVHAVLRAPKDFTSIMAGSYAGHRIEGGQGVDEWTAEGLAYYDLQYATHAYARVEAPHITVFSFSDAASLKSARAIAGFTGEVLARYGQLYRNSPSSDRSTYIIELPEYGDIASGNVFGVQEKRWREFSLGSKSAVTLAHELVHPFVQMRTPAGDPLYALSIEGAPSYFMIPVVAELRGGHDYDDRLDDVQKKYLERRKAGAKDEDGPLPPEKPLFAMTVSDVGIYKDRFVLADRALLFWDYMRRRMGAARFDAWVKDITNAQRMTASDFYASILRHAPRLLPDAHVWLDTSEYPERFRRG